MLPRAISFLRVNSVTPTAARVPRFGVLRQPVVEHQSSHQLKCLAAGLQHLDGPGMGGGMRGGMHVGPGDPLFDSHLRQGGPRGPPSGARFDPINPQGLPVRHCCRAASSAWSIALWRLAANRGCRSVI